MVGAAGLKEREAIFVRIDGTTRKSGVDERVCKYVSKCVSFIVKFNT